MAAGEVMARSGYTIIDQLSAAQMVISNTLDNAEILALVAAFGYSTEKMQRGRELCEAASAAANALRAAQKAQEEADKQYQEARQAASDAYLALAKLARTIFAGNRARLAMLGLRAPMPEATAAFLVAAAILFDNARRYPELAAYGYDAERLGSERASLTAYVEADNRREAARDAVWQTAREQQTALRELIEWTTQYIRIARIALRQKVQLLEKIGVALPNNEESGASKKVANARAARAKE
jgi:hypothetical protein